MNVLVYDVAAKDSGSLTILHAFYNALCDYQDKSINWYFILSIPQLQETENIKVFRFPWIKASWVNRLIFERFIAPRFIKKFNINIVFSMQNIGLSVKMRQIVYLHQAIPFSTYKFKITENRLFWIYQNVIGKKINDSIRKTNLTIVQTEWMKKACIKCSKVADEKIVVVKPELNIEVLKMYSPSDKGRKTFFYPATAFEYKNHYTILKACELLRQKNVIDYKVIFTLNGQENAYAHKLLEYTRSNNLNIDFVGTMSKEQIYQIYSESVLLFPSYIETFGLPLLEAKLHGSFILASDCDFAHEVLNGYGNAKFFEKFNYSQLASLMEEIYLSKINYQYSSCSKSRTFQDGWLKIIHLIVDNGY